MSDPTKPKEDQPAVVMAPIKMVGMPTDAVAKVEAEAPKQSSVVMAQVVKVGEPKQEPTMKGIVKRSAAPARKIESDILKSAMKIGTPVAAAVGKDATVAAKPGSKLNVAAATTLKKAGVTAKDAPKAFVGKKPSVLTGAKLKKVLGATAIMSAKAGSALATGIGNLLASMMNLTIDKDFDGPQASAPVAPGVTVGAAPVTPRLPSPGGV